FWACCQASAWLSGAIGDRCGDEVVHQPIEDDAAPSKIVRSQRECAIGLLEECHEASVSPHGAHDQPVAGSRPLLYGLRKSNLRERGTPKDKGSPLKRTATFKPGRSLFRIRARGLTAASRFWQRNDLWRRPAGLHPGL